jgi:mannose-6-phosphate isomerase-like protein (cupin superfamily)
VHSSGEVKFTVIRLAPNGGEVPPHFHNNVWDYFMPLEGKAVIETTTKDGVSKDFEMQPESFLAVEPGDTHRVRNVSETEEFVFLLAQSPRGKYDFVNISDGKVVKKWHEEE